ncbi:MAG TPA: hypothetical protein ENJ95_24195 [Bacteroidetes bacterium]|nr:hypothetical protein [Bacteroidota bacterium]
MAPEFGNRSFRAGKRKGRMGLFSEVFFLLGLVLYIEVCLGLYCGEGEKVMAGRGFFFGFIFLETGYGVAAARCGKENAGNGIGVVHRKLFLIFVGLPFDIFLINTFDR